MLEDRRCGLKCFFCCLFFFTIAHLTGEAFKNVRVCYLTNAFGKFVREIPNERFYTMLTYLAGQFLLVQGYLLF